MDITNLTQLISALRAETAANSITPEALGSLLQKIAECIGTAPQTGDLDAAKSQIVILKNTLTTLQKSLEDNGAQDMLRKIDLQNLRNQVNTLQTTVDGYSERINGLEEPPVQIVDLEELDNMHIESARATDPYSQKLYIVRQLQGRAYLHYGLMFMYMDGMYHSQFQVLLTNSSAQFNGSHSHNPGMLVRSWNFATVHGPVGQWSEWRELKLLTAEMEEKLNKLGINGMVDLAFQTAENLNNIRQTGIYSYDQNGTTYNLLVQDYPGRWCLQYQFTPNNINRRYFDYVMGGWTQWRTIGQDNYNPNDSYLATSKMIQDGLQDANKFGLRVGDVLNGRYVGLSMLDSAMLADIVREKRMAECVSLAYDAFQDCPSSRNGVSADGVVTIQKPTFRDTDMFISSSGSIDFLMPKEGLYVIEIDTYMYSNTVVSTSEGESATAVGGAQTVAFYLQGRRISVSVTNYFWIYRIRIKEIIGMTIDASKKTIAVNPGDSMGLINAFGFAQDGYTINIPEGVYNVGACDATDNKGVLCLNKKKVKVIGAGRDKTIITGHYLSSFSMVKCVICNQGEYNLFQDFTVVATLLTGLSGQAPAVQDDGAESIWFNCGIIGAQDTLFIRGKSHLFKGCYIEGTVDFIFGGDNQKEQDESGCLRFNHITVLKDCILACKGRGTNGVICAPSGAFVFEDCTIDDNHNYESSQDGLVYLARPWTDGCAVFFIRTKYRIMACGYSQMDPNIYFEGHGDVNGVDVYGNHVEDFETFRIEPESGTMFLADLEAYFNEASRFQDYYDN